MSKSGSESGQRSQGTYQATMRHQVEYIVHLLQPLFEDKGL